MIRFNEQTQQIESVQLVEKVGVVTDRNEIVDAINKQQAVSDAASKLLAEMQNDLAVFDQHAAAHPEAVNQPAAPAAPEVPADPNAQAQPEQGGAQ